MENRVIKFRAWDKKQKAFIAGFNMVNFHSYYNAGSEPSIYRYNTKWNLSEIELMQFTGLKDKNGIEIYEGDVVAWDYEYDADYDGDMPIVKRSVGRKVVKDIFDRWQIFEARDEGKGVEVIGNIYANPELT